METYLRRLYLQRPEEEEGGPYPVWDCRMVKPKVRLHGYSNTTSHAQRKSSLFNPNTTLFIMSTFIATLAPSQKPETFGLIRLFRGFFFPRSRYRACRNP
ncbi:hypothetical protein ACOMHN_062061 [Nucella lapillus]